MRAARNFRALLMAIFVARLWVGWAGEARAAALVWTPATNVVRTAQLLTNVTTSFAYTNTTAEDIAITAVEASCHCTTPQIGKLPWIIPAHAAGKMEVVVEIPGKWGIVQKTIALASARETNTLLVVIDIPEPDPRQKNQVAAFADRQAVFKGDCATCHAKPTVGLMGEALFAKACGICHESTHRASMVPDLAARPHGDVVYWSQWIRIGKPGSLMPGFDKPHGGPLSDEQIGSLVDYLQKKFPAGAEKAKLPLE